ncbi:peptidyl-prolyl cis-trans isomerase [Roseovarius sp. C7]|uniref:peptidyl-prolyl cis-trans isomerase n=1 Tax=Roseovarius sp. C7 TaxID=3398643 RepID=UPI0039F5FC4C
MSKTAVWILLGLLILGLGGFGVTNLSGTVRSVGSVGDTKIDIDDYARTLQNEIRALEAQRGERLSFAQARELGLDQAVLSRLVTTTALEDEAQRIGLSIGDGNLRNEILNIQAFQGLDGEFDREAYSFALEQAGLNEAQFEDDLRAETARTLLQGAVVAGVRAPAVYGDTLINYLGERRDVSWAVLGRGALETGLPEPTEEELATYHQSNVSEFTTPETKVITYAWVTPEMILDTVEVDEETLRTAYEERSPEYNQPERRLVERLVFLDEATAEAALERIAGGEASFEDLVAERELELSDVDIGDVTRSELGAAGDAVFEAEAGDVVGPLASDLGPALFRVNGVLAAQVVPFEEAEPMLRDELAGDRARRVIETSMDSIDDLLAGGATIEELAEETDLTLGTIEWHPEVTDGIGGYESFRQAADALSSDDYPEVIELDDGGLFAMRLDKIEEPRVLPVDEVREELAAAWTRQTIVDALREQARQDVAKLADGASFQELGYTNINTAKEITRQGFEADAPREFIETVFEMETGGVEIIDGQGRLFILRLDNVQDPDTEAQDRPAEPGAQEPGGEFPVAGSLQALADDIRNRAGITLDQSALNAVHANFQ